MSSALHASSFRCRCLVLLASAVLGSSLATTFAEDIVIRQSASRVQEGETALPAVKNFQLRDAAGKAHALADYRESKVIVLVFLGTECPVSNGYAPEFRRMAEKFSPQGVVLLGVHSDPTVTADAARKHAAEYQLTFPILLDAEQKLARALGITAVPETVVMLPTGAVIYRGRVDDRYSADGKRRDVPRSQDLRDAITSGVAGKSPAIAETKPFGCALPTAPAATAPAISK